MSEDKVMLTDEAAVKITAGILTEMITQGEKEAELIDKLPKEFQSTVMKTNTLLSLATVILYKIVESNDAAAARGVVGIWTSDSIQQLISIAFKEEVDAAEQSIQDGIAQVEDLANKENNASSSGASA
jgi:hypothetical protein